VIDYSFDGFENISNEAIDLVKLMTCKNPKNRLSVRECLKHPWFKIKIATHKTLEKVINCLKSPHREYNNKLTKKLGSNFQK